MAEGKLHGGSQMAMGSLETLYVSCLSGGLQVMIFKFRKLKIS